MILSAQSIETRDIIDPFHKRTQIGDGTLTFGVGPCSYDVRVEFDDKGLIGMKKLLPGDFILASTIEHFEMPDDVMGVAHDKSSWARRGIAVQNTLIDPGWYGYLTLEITNHGSVPVMLRRGDPIAQIVFHQLDQTTDIPYDGKYQAQRRGPITPR